MQPESGRKRSRSPMLDEVGKSKSCEETPTVRRRNRRQRRKGANETDVEMKRRSVYAKDFCRYSEALLLVPWLIVQQLQ